MRALLCVLLAAAVSFAQGGRKKPTFDVPESERAAPAGPTAEAERDAMRRTVSRLAGWPHERARRAAERLIVQKEKSRNTVLAVLLSTEREHRALKPGAAYVLGRIGEPAHFMTLLHVAIEKQQQKHAAVFLEAAWRLDQPRAVAESFRFFHLSTTTLRREATRFVLDRVKRDNLPAILDLLDRRKAERPFTREIGLRLLDRLVQTREVEWKDVQHYFYRSLGDDSPGVASRSMRMLASLNNKENIGELNQRIAGEKMPWRKRSYAALSLSILSSAFKVQPYSEEAIAVLKGRKGMGHPREILARSSSALALTQVALRTNREEYVRMLDRAIPERLIEAVGGTRRHYRDFGTVMPLAFATLRRITGQTLPDEAPAWARWWQDHNRSFRAKRELNGIAEQDLSSMVVEIARPAASGGTRMRLQVVGGAKPVFRHGRAFALAKADMSALLDELSAAKFFTRAEERSEEPARDAAVFVVRVGDLDRSVAYGSGSEGDLALRERLLMRVQTLADRYVWQHFWDADTQPSWNLFFLENHRWFKTHADAEEHAIRLRGMITGSLDDMIDPGARLFATRFLAGLSGGGAALDERQVTSMVQAVAAEPAANEFVGEVVDLLVPAAGSDAAVGLVGALATKVGPSAQAMLEHLCASTTQQQVAKLSSDKRWKVRRAAVRALAKRDTKLSRPLLRARLEDDEALVRVAAAEALARQKDRSILPRLQKMAKSESARVREVTAYSLALLGSRESLGSLRALLFEDSVPSVRAHAVEGLVESRHPDAPELLIDVFRQESDVGVRSAAATGIVKLESPDLVNELMDRLQLTTALDPERVALVNVLARFRSEAPMDLLRQVLQGDDQPSADAAALGLARQWEDASLTQLVRMAKRGGPTTRVAVRHLQLLTSQEFKTESYRRQAESYSAWATSALSENPRKWYMDALTTRGYDTRELRGWAEGATPGPGKVTDAMVPVLLKALRDRDWFIQRNASYLLSARIGATAPAPIDYRSNRDEVEGTIRTYFEWWAKIEAKRRAEKRG